MIKKSIWHKGVKTVISKPLKENLNVDVLIIGGGITGISTAYQLKDTDLNICLVERGKIGNGVTSKTTGKLNYLQGTIYSKIEHNYSYEKASLYLTSQRHAIKIVKDIVQKENIDCNFEKTTSYVFTNDKKEIKTLMKEKAILSSLGQKIKTSYEMSFPLKITYSISATDTATFHPLKYIYALKEIIKDKIKIYEETEVYYIKKEKDYYICKTKKNEIKAKYVVLACHYPFFIFPYFMPIKTYIEKSYITASKSVEYHKDTCISSKQTKSFRYYKDTNNYLIYLSNSHPICDKIDTINNFTNIVKEVHELGYNPDYIWSNEDIMTYDNLPFIGEIDKNLFLATGYNTWGMTNGTIAAYIICNLILNKKTIYDEIFNPLRKNISLKAQNYPKNIVKNIKGYVPNKLKIKKSWYPYNLKFKKINGKQIAIYKDNEEHIVYTKCPHMGCPLIFNEIEKTWDCPCHASRFALDGKCIKGPSLYNISFKKSDKS